jgi:glutathione S-transferase
MADITLYQFPISHYCEKIRWVLDHKGLRYTINNQLPGLHMVANRRLVGRGSVPVLVDGHHAIGESSDIALYLDDQFPEARLIPSEAAARARVLALEAYFDEHAGPAVRRYIYSFLTTHVGRFRSVFFAGYGGMARLVGAVASGAVARQIAQMYKVGPASAAQSLAAIEAACCRLDELVVAARDGYLVGDRLTLADVTAASLLGPLIGPPRSPWTMELDIPELVALRDALRARPCGRWVLARYAHDRPVLAPA